jgi:hypothetical protein
MVEMRRTNAQCQRVMMAMNRARSPVDSQRTVPHTPMLKPCMQESLERQMGKTENYRVAKLHLHCFISGL